MGAFQNYLNTLKGTVDGPIVLGGTLFPTSEKFPVMKAAFITSPLPSLDTLVDIPYQWLELDMEVVVSQYEMSGGTIHPRTKYILALMPPANTRVNEVPSYVLSNYWKKESESSFNAEVESQWAPNFEGKRPRFLPTEISSAAYQAGYPTTDTYTGGNPSDIIWVDDFDPTAGHAWIRQRLEGTTTWGIPVSLNAGGDYEANQYIDTIFRWVTKGNPAPAKPVQPSDYAVLPTGWDNTPGANYSTRILTEDLYYSQALKNPYGVLKSDWSLPLLISSDPNVVRYGNTPGNTDFLNDTYWRGYYTPGLDTHMATRPDSLSTDWTIRKIDQESGEFPDFVFKNLPIGIDGAGLIAATPTAPYPVGGVAPNDWSDDPPAPEENKIRYMSTTVKYPDGSLKKPWSLPRRFDGLDTILAVIETTPGDTFFLTRVAGELEYTFPSIVLSAVLYKGNEALTTGFNTVKWYKGNTLIVFDSMTRKATNLGVQYNQYHEVSVDGKSLTINPEGFDSTQEYRVGINHETRPDADYEANVLLKDSTDDGNAYVADIKSENGTTFKNQTGLYKFEGNFFKGGVLDVTGVTFSWTIRDALGVVIADGLKDDNGDPVGDEDYEGLEVYLDGADIDQYATLELTATFGDVVRTDTITITDVQDAVALEVLYWGTGSTDPGNPTDFSPRTLTKAEVLALSIGYLEDSTGTWYRIERVGGIWGGEIKMRSESARPNGGTYIQIFKNVDFSVDGAPAAPAVPASGSLIPAGWTQLPTALVGSQDATYETSCFFLLRTDVAADPTILTRDNYNPAFAFYGTPIRKSGDNPPPVAGADNGWSPEIANEFDNNRVIQKLVDWFGGTGTKPSADSDSHYLGPNGFTTKDLATDIRGLTGNTAAVRPLFHQAKNIGTQVSNPGTRIDTGDGELEAVRIVIQNTWSASRKFLIRGQVSVREVSDSSIARIRLRVTEFAANTDENVTLTIANLTIADGNRQRIDVGDGATGEGHKIEVSTVQTLLPGQRFCFVVSVQKVGGDDFYHNNGYIEAIGL